ncbi:MAG: sortase [bacterium]|nr:sortase [bacterium]
MALHVYVKENTSPKKKVVNYISYVALTFGTLLLFWSFYPIISFEIYSRIFMQNNMNTPIPKNENISSVDQANSVLGSFNVFSNNLRDFTKANVWFPTKPQNVGSKSLSLKEYFLSIPKINIKDVKVVVGGEDLTKSLIHYFPQTLPGEYGNVVIFGHSTLPQLYNSKDYKTIFTYLPSLDKGDVIILKVNNLDYEYTIYDMFVVNPDQVSILDQKNDAAYVTLVTCVPPGTYWKRLVVRAKLTQLPR